ncbi:hypothetical protein M2163_003114 [Streptomyces sp. SAI-135]|nr:hypothetical protein [Streptomyces sp. SAI-090]MDH6616006.1 hypothetical protein [Streptomyces sp. SAI-135]
MRVPCPVPGWPTTRDALRTGSRPAPGQPITRDVPRSGSRPVLRVGAACGLGRSVAGCASCASCWGSPRLGGFRGRVRVLCCVLGRLATRDVPPTGSRPVRGGPPGTSRGRVRVPCSAPGRLTTRDVSRAGSRPVPRAGAAHYPRRLAGGFASRAGVAHHPRRPAVGFASCAACWGGSRPETFRRRGRVPCRGGPPGTSRGRVRVPCSAPGRLTTRDVPRAGSRPVPRAG